MKVIIEGTSREIAQLIEELQRDAAVADKPLNEEGREFLLGSQVIVDSKAEIPCQCRFGVPGKEE